MNKLGKLLFDLWFWVMFEFLPKAFALSISIIFMLPIAYIWLFIILPYIIKVLSNK